ncbi:uncharacterized protein LOC131009620 [Salvia miltiorrhiza]|uniref:uncharacterized protein LOC131009620 n=1 Tax=Salvia miltiorrhiza TaxID=226208 RepID=UPI0025AD606A|nr:uncharacterized protein LOC131009620 [Salvia miltiorrhiza]
MKRVFPDTDLKGVSQHINSKISAWKKNYNSLSTMLGISGVGFNVHGDHMVDVTNEQWELIAKNMRYKSWPMLDAWKEVFDKDRATGDNAEDLMDAAQNTPDGDYHVNLEAVMENGVVEESASQCKRSEGTTSGIKKKRK